MNYTPSRILQQLLDKTILFASVKNEKHFSHWEMNPKGEAIWELKLAKQKLKRSESQFFTYLAVQDIGMRERFQRQGIATHYFTLLEPIVMAFGFKGACVQTVHSEHLGKLLKKLGWRERDQNLYSPEMQKLIEW